MQYAERYGSTRVPPRLATLMMRPFFALIMSGNTFVM